MVDAEHPPLSSQRESLTEIRHRERVATRRDLAEMAKRIADHLEEKSDRPLPLPRDDGEPPRVSVH